MFFDIMNYGIDLFYKESRKLERHIVLLPRMTHETRMGQDAGPEAGRFLKSPCFRLFQLFPGISAYF